MNSPTFLGSNINLVKAHNLRAILLSLLYDGHVSRVELAEKTSLSTTTITNLTAELLEQGIILEEQNKSLDKHRSVGRPRTMLRLVPNARYAVGVHIGVGLFRVAITDLCAQIVHNTISAFEIGTPASDLITAIAQVVTQTITESGVDLQRIIGVGVGASGLVDNLTGVNVLAPRLGWRDAVIREPLQELLGIPVCVDNNVRTMAVGEAFFGAGRGVSVLAFVYGRIGVGSGIVVGGEIFRGSGAGAGEIGHTTMLNQDGEICSCGNRGCLETLVSEPVLVRKAKTLARKYPQGILADYLAKEGDDKPIQRIFAAARDGDEKARDMITQLAENLGIALANLVNILNPELIILGGMFNQGHDLILPTAESTMRERAFAGLGEKVRLQPTSFGWRAGVIGAAALALTTFFYQQPDGI